MRILVTGAAGFVGRHLCDELLEHDHDVIATDKADADLALPYSGAALIHDWRPEYVVHLAARYGRILCREEPHKAVADNTASTVELAAACADTGIPVLYASSSEVYGDHGEALIDELSPLRMPTTIYGLSKRWGEEALKLYLPAAQRTIVRMNMLYGPGQRAGHGCCALATFVASALAQRRFIVHRGTTRSWLFIADAIRALRALIEERFVGTWNLGNPAPPVHMEAVGAGVLAASGRLGESDLIGYADPPADQIQHKNYSSRKLIDATGWLPEVPLWQGIQRTVEWARGETYAEPSDPQEPDPGDHGRAAGPGEGNGACARRGDREGSRR